MNPRIYTVEEVAVGVDGRISHVALVTLTCDLETARSTVDLLQRCVHLVPVEGNVAGPPADSVTGFDRAPDRYSGQGRETIDRIRDQLGDDGFVAFCLGNAAKYEDRQGRKGDAEVDRAKANWYWKMAEHVRTGGTMPDPRRDRPDFVPYRRPE